nr:hypothetical protein [Azospirillum sp. 412522]
MWILRGRDLYAPGLAAYGLTPDRLVAVRAGRAVDALWVMEEALRSSALSAVLGELEGLDLTASRRLQLAAESSGVTGFLLDLSAGGPVRRKSGRVDGLSAAVTRWRLDAAPSLDEEDAASRPVGALRSLGTPRWSVALERCRSGRQGHWTLAWDGEGWRDLGGRGGNGDGSGLGQTAESDPGIWPAQQPMVRQSIAKDAVAKGAMSDNRQTRLSDHRKPAVMSASAP